MPDLHRRFRELAIPLFEVHEIVHVGFWIAEIGTSNQLHWLLRWNTMAERESKWTAFMADPKWQIGHKASEESGPLVIKAFSELWLPTDYSALP